MSHLTLPKSPTSAQGLAGSPREPSERDEADQSPTPLCSSRGTQSTAGNILQATAQRSSHPSLCPEDPGAAAGGLSPNTEQPPVGPCSPAAIWSMAWKNTKGNSLSKEG